MMEKIRPRILIALLIMLWIIPSEGVSAAQEWRSPLNFIVITEVSVVSSCSDVAINFIYNNNSAAYLVIRVDYAGQTVSDNLVALPAGTGGYAYVNTGYYNDRGLAPANLWPLAPGSKVKLYLTLYDLDFVPSYEARATLKSCDATTLKSDHGPAYQLLRNSSFENPGRDSSHLAVPEEAAFWTGTNTVNDARACDPARLRAGSSVYVGECGYLFNADSVTKSKLTQDYTGTIGDAGDTVMLQGFVQSFAGYAGGGKLIALLRFADGTTQKIKQNFRVGQWLHTYPNSYPYFVTATLPAPLISATVTIKQGFSAAQAAVDAVTLTLFSKNGGALRAVPPAPDASPVKLTASH